MTLITYAKCAVCGKEEPCSKPPTPPIGWIEIVYVTWSMITIRVCSHVCFLKLATDNFKSEEARLAEIKKQQSAKEQNA